MWMSLALLMLSPLHHPQHSAAPHLPSPLGPHWLWQKHSDDPRGCYQCCWVQLGPLVGFSSPPVWGACLQPYMPRLRPRPPSDCRPATVAGAARQKPGGRRPADGASREETHGWELEGEGPCGWILEVGDPQMGLRGTHPMDGNLKRGDQKMGLRRRSPMELGGGTYGWEFEVGDAQMETLRNLKGEDPQMVIQGRNPVDGM